MLAPLLVMFGVAAGSVPYINIQKICRAAQATGLSVDQKAAYEGCVADENEAKQTLLKTWGRISRANRQSCVDQSMSFSPSYVEMLTCLEMRDGGRFTGGAAPTVPPPAAPSSPTPSSPTPSSPTPSSPPGAGATGSPSGTGAPTTVPLPSSTSSGPGTSPTPGSPDPGGGADATSGSAGTGK